MKVDRPADFFFDSVQCLARGANLFARDWYAADAFGRAFYESVDMGLAGGANDHDVVGAVPGSHTHAPQVVLETARSDFRGDDEIALRVNVIERVGGGQRDRLRKIFGGVAVNERCKLVIFQFVPPGPAFPFGPVTIEIAQNIAQIDFFVCR